MTNYNYIYIFARMLTVDGSWSQWSSWSSCSVTCDEGLRTRTRTCAEPSPQGGGADCVGSKSGMEKCKIVSCLGGTGETVRYSSDDKT